MKRTKTSKYDDNSDKSLISDPRRSSSRGNIIRTASCNRGGIGGSDIVGIQPEYFVPQLENSSLELPRYRQEIVSWCDYYYQTNEMIGAAVDTHATLSVSDFSISCKDKHIQQEYEDMLEDIDYTQLLSDIANEYFRLGNAFPMGYYDADNLTWKEFTLLPMLNIELRKSILQRDPKIYLVIDDVMKNMGSSSDPTIVSEYDLLPPEVREGIQFNLPILIDPSRIDHISTRSIAGTLWGPSPIFRCFKTLVYSDKIFRAQEAIADNQITPIKIISMLTPDGYPVAGEEADDLREQLAEASFDPNYFIIASGEIKDNYIGSNGKILPLNSEQDMIERKLSSGLRISKALLHGEGPTYANAQVYQSTMTFYYQAFRNKLKKFLKNKVFKPIAEARGYYDITHTEKSSLNLDDKTKRLLIPEIYFRGTGLLDQQTITIMDRLNSNKKISDETFISMIMPEIDYENEKVKILRQESEKVVLKKVSPELGQSVEQPDPKDMEDSMSEEKIEDDKAKTMTKMKYPTPDNNNNK